jgi:acetyl esterase
MTIDPQVRKVLDKLKEFGAKPPRMTSLDEARKGLDAFMEYVRATGGVEEVSRIEDRKIPGPAGDIPVRIYVPYQTPIGAIVYFHGGGWVIGGIFSHDNVCRSFANAAGCIVIAVDYRLAPENKFPAAPEDCYAATVWAADNAEMLGYPAGKLAVGGDSAGGNLATVMCLMARDRGGPKIAYQLLIYPATDSAMNTRSYKEFWGDGYFLSGADMEWFWNNYLAQFARSAAGTGNYSRARPAARRRRGLCDQAHRGGCADLVRALPIRHPRNVQHGANCRCGQGNDRASGGRR